MHDEYQALENIVYFTQADFATHLGELQARVDEEPQRVYYTISEDINNLRYEFETLKSTLFAELDTLIEKMRECARANDLVDEQGGALDEFLDGFKPQETTSKKEVMNKNEC